MMQQTDDAADSFREGNLWFNPKLVHESEGGDAGT
jgi:hypothetical protein